jgi:outer membrane autotransporter protein
MGNVYYDFGTPWWQNSSGLRVAPYLGAGVGDASVHEGHGSVTTAFHHNTDDFAYQGMAGLNFASSAMPNTEWYIGYRYYATGNSDLHANNAELGVRFNF